jgi:hypothetical protein
MDERSIAAALATALIAKTEFAPEKDAVQVATQIYRRMLLTVRKVHASEGQAPSVRLSAVRAGNAN